MDDLHHSPVSGWVVECVLCTSMLGCSDGKLVDSELAIE